MNRLLNTKVALLASFCFPLSVFKIVYANERTPTCSAKDISDIRNVASQLTKETLSGSGCLGLQVGDLAQKVCRILSIHTGAIVACKRTGIANPVRGVVTVDLAPVGADDSDACELARHKRVSDVTPSACYNYGL